MLQYFLELNKDGGRLKTPGYILFIALIVIIALTFASNVGWLIYANNNGNTNSNYTVTQSGSPTSIIGDGNNGVTPQETPAE